MIRIIGVLSFLLVFLFNQGNTNNQVTINGRISGSNTPEKIFYSLPVNGVCFTYGYNDYWLIDKAIIDNTGSFEIKTEIENPAFIRLLFNDIPPFIIEPGKRYDLRIDSKSNDFSILAKDQTVQLHELFHSWPMENPRRCDWIENISRDLKSFDFLRSELEKEIYQLNELLTNGLISDDLYKLVKLERKVYYAVAIGIISSDVVKSNIIEKKTIPVEFFNAWGESFDLIDISDKNLIRTTLAYDLLDNYYWHKAYSIYGVEEFLENRRRSREQGLIHTYTMSVAENIFNDEILEFYKAGYIFFYLVQLQSDPELNLLLTNFVDNYPESNYLKFLPSILSEK